VRRRDKNMCVCERERERERENMKCERNDKEIEEEIKEGNKKHENILKSPTTRNANVNAYQYRKRYEYL
jgi:hypothetical protein